MRFQIGIENNMEGRSLAWALEYPGCFAYGTKAETALAAMPEAIANYAAWIASRNHGRSWLETTEIELHWTETWRVYSIDDAYNVADQGYEVNAWFRQDWRPLTDIEIERLLQLFSWTRTDLLSTISGLNHKQLTAQHPGERWSIAEIMKHVGQAEWWYLERLGLAFSPDRLPVEALPRLKKVRRRLVDVLPKLAGVQQVIGRDGEFWSPRKLVRRAMWHERDHTLHILKLIQS